MRIHSRYGPVSGRIAASKARGLGLTFYGGEHTHYFSAVSNFERFEWPGKKLSAEGFVSILAYQEPLDSKGAGTILSGFATVAETLFAVYIDVMIPFEALMPYGVIITVSFACLFCYSAFSVESMSAEPIIFQMIGIASGGMALGNTLRQDGKKMRTHRDQWDKMSMSRNCFQKKKI